MPSDLIRRVVSGFKEPFASANFLPFTSTGLSGARLWQSDIGLGRYVLRRWPQGQMTAWRLSWIHRRLAEAYNADCRFVPVPMATRSSATFVAADDTYWQLEPWMPGKPDLIDPPRLQMVAAAVAALAQFHEAVRRRGDRESDHPQIPRGAASPNRSPALLQRAELLEEMRAGGIERIRNAPAFVAPTECWSGIGVAARPWLAMAPDRALSLSAEVTEMLEVTLPLQPVVRDVTRDHVLFSGDDTAGRTVVAKPVVAKPVVPKPIVTGLVDFGAMCDDHVTVDLARLAGSYGGNASIYEQVWRIYRQSKHALPLTELDRRLIELLDRSGTWVAAYRWLRWIFVEEREFDDPQGVARRIERLMARCIAFETP